MSDDEKALTVSAAGFNLVDPSQLPSIETSDMEGYSEPDWKAFTYIRIRQKPKTDDKGKTVCDAGGFDIRNEILGEVPDELTIHGIILVDKLNARTRWEDEKPACKSLDGINGINPRTGEECGQCAICPWAKEEEDSAKQCKKTPILFMDEAKYGPCVVTFTVSAIRPLGIFYGQLKLKARELKLTAKMLPPHFFYVEISTQYKRDPQPHYIPVVTITDMVPKDKLEGIRQDREAMIRSLTGDASRFVEDDIDVKHAREAAKIEDEEYKPKDDLPF